MALVLATSSGVIGANAKYSIGSSQAVTAFSWMAWVYFRSNVTAAQYLLNLNFAANGTIGTIVNLSAGVPNIWAFGGAGSMRPCSTTLANGRWYHLCVTWDGVDANGVNWYADGAAANGLVGSAPGAPHNYDNYSIGGRSHAYASDTDRNIVDGLVHKVRVFKRVLTALEIANYYANPYQNDPVSTYPSDLLIRADYDATTDTNHGAKTTTQGTAVLTSRGPLDLPARHLSLDYAGSTTPDAAGVANTTAVGPTRFSALGDYSCCGGALAESGTSGQLRVLGSSALKIGVTHGNAVDGTARYVERATGTGPTWDNQRCSLVAWLAPTVARADTLSKPIISLGDPATANSAILQLNMTTAGYPQISRSTPGTEAVIANIQYQTGLPRFVGVACGTTERLLQMDRSLKTDSSAFTSATATGIRVGCELGATTNYFVGDIYRIDAYDRKLHPNELMALYEWGKSVYLYDDVAWALWGEGSSTMYGYNSPNGLNFMTQLGQHATFRRVYMCNQSNAGENRSHFNTGFATQGQVFATNMSTHLGIPKSRLICWFQPFGNDWDGVTTLADIQTAGANNYDTIFGKFRTYYGVVSVFEPVVRTDYATDPADEQREADLKSFMLFCSPYGRIRRRPIGLRPADGTALALQTVTATLSYIGDEIHLSNTGYAQYDESVEIWLLEDMGLSGIYADRMRRFPAGSTRVLRSTRFDS